MGVIRAFGPEGTPALVEGPIKRPEDLKTYRPPDPEASDVLGNIPEIVASYKGKRAITALACDAFFNPVFLRGMEQFLVDIIEYPARVHEVIKLTLHPAHPDRGCAGETAAASGRGCGTAHRPHPRGRLCGDRSPGADLSVRLGLHWFTDDMLVPKKGALGIVWVRTVLGHQPMLLISSGRGCGNHHFGPWRVQ